MRKLISALSFAWLVTAGASPSTIAGQTIPSPYRFIETGQELGPFIGHLDSDRGRFSLGPGAATMYGLRYGIQLGDSPLAFEATSFLASTSRHVVDPRRAEGDRVVDDLDSFLLGADVRLRFSLTGPRTWYDLNPYASVGLGAAGDLRSHDIEELPIPAEFDFRFGPAFMGVGAGGVRWLPFRNIGLRGEGAVHVWRLGTPQGFAGLEDELGPVPEQEWTMSPSFTFAVTYLF